MQEPDRIPELLHRLGVFSLRIGLDGSVEQCNNTFAEFVGRDPGSIVGLPHADFFGPFDLGKAAVFQGPIEREGSQTAVVRWSLTPEFADDGALLCLKALGLEVRDESRTTAVVDAARDRGNEGVFLIDGNGRIEKINRTAELVFGLSRSESSASSPVLDRDVALAESGDNTYAHWDLVRGVASVGNSTSQDIPAHLKLSASGADGDLPYGNDSAGFPGLELEIETVSIRDARKTKLLTTIRELLMAVIGTGPIEVARRVLAPMAELLGACAGAIVLDVEGESHVESFGLPPETAWLVGDLLPLSQSEPARLQALTRLHLLASVPLKGPHGHLGDVLLFSRNLRSLDAEQRDILEHLSRSLTMVLERILMTKELGSAREARDSAHESLLQALVAALDLRDHETEGHTQRVTRMSVQLGIRLGLNPDALRCLEHGALLHDVGKIGIPDSILHKPGPLTPEEWEIMRRHPQYAFDILAPLPLMSHALEVPFSHHERFDGTGYPQGLVGRDIPLAARIFAVVDVYDAMTTERPYRPALDPDFAIAHVRSHSGTHFDPIVVEAFCDLIDSMALEGTSSFSEERPESSNLPNSTSSVQLQAGA